MQHQDRAVPVVGTEGDKYVCVALTSMQPLNTENIWNWRHLCAVITGMDVPVWDLAFSPQLAPSPRLCLPRLEEVDSFLHNSIPAVSLCRNSHVRSKKYNN